MRWTTRTQRLRPGLEHADARFGHLHERRLRRVDSGSPTTIVGVLAENLTVGCYRYVLTGTDNVGNAVSVQTDVLVHGAATQIALTGATTNLTSGATRALTATVKDATGNTVVTDGSTVVAFAQPAGTGTVTAPAPPPRRAASRRRPSPAALAGAITIAGDARGGSTVRHARRVHHRARRRGRDRCSPARPPISLPGRPGC